MRAPILVVLAGALVAAGLIDRVGATGLRAGAAPAPAPVPVAAPASALSTSWFCAGATSAGGRAPGSIVIANSGSGPASGVVTLLSSRGGPRRLPVTVGPGTRQVVAETPGPAATAKTAKTARTTTATTTTTPAWVGAIVDIDAGAVGVQQQIVGRDGVASAPCATAGSSQWYFPAGATLINAGVELSLLNPYPADSVVDLSFTTDQGLEAPQGFQGLVVPAGGMLNVNLGDHLRRRQSIATTVTARTGRVVAWKTDWVDPPARGSALLGTPAALSPLADPAAPVPGLTLSLGAPSAGTSWTWADGLAGAGLDERYVIYNPGAVTADVKLAVTLAQGVAEPFALTVGPGQVATVASDQEARIPAGVPHTAVLESTNNVPVVAARTLSAGAGARWSGLGELLGGRVAAPNWLLPAVQAGPKQEVWIVLSNPGDRPIRAIVDVLGPGGPTRLSGLGALVVDPGRRAAVRLNDVARSLGQSLLVTSTGAVYAETDTYGTAGSPGVSLSFGIPLSP